MTGIFIPTLAADGVTDDATAINAALADPAHSIVMLPAGVIAVDSTVRIPAGKTLLGSGRGQTTVLALSTFDRHIDLNAVIASVQGATDVGLGDMAIDANKVGFGLDSDERIQATIMDQARRFSAQRVDVRNCTGYGFLARGDPNFYTVYGSGIYIDCTTTNCQVHFEQMTCDGVTVIGGRCSDGDGDIGVEAFLHPIAGSRNITYMDCRGKGACTGGLLINANQTEPQSNIRVIGCDVESTNGGIGLVCVGSVPTSEIYLSDSRFAGLDQIGADIGLSHGRAVNCRFEGKSIGVRVATDGSSWTFTGCDASGIWPDPGTTAYGLAAPPSVRWVGGVITAEGTSGSIPVSSGAFVSPDTKLNPRGGGYRLRKVLHAAGDQSSNPAGRAIGASYSDPWTFPVEAERRYRIDITGAWSHASASASGMLAIQGDNGASGALRGELRLETAPNVTASKIVTAIDGVGDAASEVSAIPSAANTLSPMGGWAVFQCTTSGTLTIEFGTSDPSFAMTVMGLSTLIVDEI